MPNFYVSGSLGSAKYRERIYALTSHRLLSLHGDYTKVAATFVQTVGNARDPATMELLFDSGAFTAWNNNEPDIDVKWLLKVYMRAVEVCIEKFKFKAVRFISLDKIPGAPGRTASADEMRDAIRISDENHKVLSAELGNLVLPVFHQSESVARLHEVIALNPEYICVSPRNDLREFDRRKWAMRTHHLLPAGLRTHGLATTGGNMMLDVPWHSVDSASWIQSAAYGNIFVAFPDSLQIIPVSEHSSSRRKWGNHTDNMPETVRGVIRATCDELKLTIEELRTELAARELFNVFSMNKHAARPTRDATVQDTLLEL